MKMADDDDESVMQMADDDGSSVSGSVMQLVQGDDGSSNTGSRTSLMLANVPPELRNLGKQRQSVANLHSNQMRSLQSNNSSVNFHGSGL